MFQLSNWFKDLRLSAIVHPPPLDNDDCKNTPDPKPERKESCHFGLFVINPKMGSALEKISQEHYRECLKYFKYLAREFYSKIFISDEATEESINLALDTETTIMIVVKHVTGGIKAKRKEMFLITHFPSTNGLKVIAAITFRRCVEKEQKRSKEEEQKKNVSCAVSWLLVIACHTTVHPSEINGWR